MKFVEKLSPEYCVYVAAIFFENGEYIHKNGYVRNDPEALREYFVDNPNCLLHYPIYIGSEKREKETNSSLFDSKITILARGGKGYTEWCLLFNVNGAHINGNGFEYNKWRDEWDCMKQLKSDELITYLNAFVKDGIRNTCESYLNRRLEQRERYMSHYKELGEFSKIVNDPQIIKRRLDEIFYAIKFLDEDITGIRGVLANLQS